MKDYRKFFTPDDVADRLCYLADLGKGFIKVLEPHAGEGYIVSAINRSNRNAIVYAVEINPLYASKLPGKIDMLTIGDFLEVPLRPVFDRVVANPPFNSDDQIELISHMEKMYGLLVENGKMVSIVPKGFGWGIQDVRIPLSNWTTNNDGSLTELEILVAFKK